MSHVQLLLNLKFSIISFLSKYFMHLNQKRLNLSTIRPINLILQDSKKESRLFARKLSTTNELIYFKKSSKIELQISENFDSA